MSETGEIDLAREPEFRLGRLRVIPSLREIRINGRTEIIEPKVMQVLVALFRADGGVLSRDLLIERCWGGRIVGEDAINRCIAKVRKVAELDGNCSFAVETVARVGYRMIRSNESAELGENAGLAPKDKERTPRSAWASRVALGMGGLALAAFAWRVFQPEPEWTIDRFQMLVSSPYLEDQPAIAPNGTMIAYAATTADGVRSIFIRNLTEGEPGRLTDNHDVDEHSPAWSPQSDRIAFVRYVPGKPCTILIKPVPAGTVQEAAHCLTNEDTRLAWGADGALYFADQPKIGQTSRIVRLDLATGKRRDVTHPDPLTANDKEPSISPDGHMLAFYRDQYPHSGIFVTDLTTGKERKVTPDRISVWGDGWTSDSRSLIVGTLEPDEPALWAYHIDGRPAQRLTFNQQEFGRVVGGPNDLEAV
jgi:DNA-binding winged helix-turn-helix (wHTH) protein